MKGIFKERCSITQSKHALIHHDVNEWKKFPEQVVSASTLKTFKTRYDQHILQIAMEAGNRIWLDHWVSHGAYW